jgi:hypothetical protein
MLKAKPAREKYMKKMLIPILGTLSLMAGILERPVKVRIPVSQNAGPENGENKNECLSQEDGKLTNKAGNNIHDADHDDTLDRSREYTQIELAWFEGYVNHWG